MCMLFNLKVDVAFIFWQVNRDDDTVRPSFQDYAQDLKVRMFSLVGSGICVIDHMATVPPD